ncbi:ABC transporter transmembrane domain-containing protein [Candidatus Bathyarchaeota archaeon]|nr:ABC transporter transmembrane domain-containing protein [Candidatus Bathyarchaeota archaeon]
MGFPGGPGGGGFGGRGGGGLRGRGEGQFSRVGDEKYVRKASDRILLKRIMIYLGPYRRRIATLTTIMVASSLVSLVTPLLTKILLDQLVQPSMTVGDTLNLWLIAMIGVMLIQFGLNYFQNYLTAWIGNKTIYQMRKDLVLQLQTMSIQYFAGGETGTIMSRVIYDTDELSDFLGSAFPNLISDIVGVIGALLFMFILSRELALVSLLAISIMFVLPFFLRSYIRKAFRQTRAQLAGMTSVLQESVSGMRVVQSFTQEEKDMETFNDANLGTMKAGLRTAFLSGIFIIGVGLAQVTGTVTLLWYGTIQVVVGAITFGTLVAFQQLVISF